MFININNKRRFQSATLSKAGSCSRSQVLRRTMAKADHNLSTKSVTKMQKQMKNISAIRLYQKQ